MKKYQLCIVEFELGKNPRLTTWAALRTDREFPVINSSIGAYQFINDMGGEGWLVQHVETDFSGSNSVFMTVWLQREDLKAEEDIMRHAGTRANHMIVRNLTDAVSKLRIEKESLPTRFDVESED